MYWRRSIQLFFLTLTLAGVFLLAGNAERWCPFGGIESLYSYASNGELLCSLGTSNFFILAGILLLTLLTARSFCGYVCPIGIISDWLLWAARRIGLKPRQIGGHADQLLSLVKYAVLALILVMTWRTSELWFRGYDPCYALISRHGDDIQIWAYVVAGTIVLGSILVSMPFCRWLCPFAAVLNAFSRFSLTRIRRNEQACTGCGQCTRACPMNIPVHQELVVAQARCISCMNCLDACNALKFHALEWGPPKRLKGPWPKSALAAILAVCVVAAVALSYAAPLPAFTRSRGQAPQHTAVTQLQVEGLTCRGKATQFTERYLFRDDALSLPGYLKVEAWPGPGKAAASVHYDPSNTTPEAIRHALTEAIYDPIGDIWRASPFSIEGFDPLAAGSVSP
jgi:polyferredoxin